MQLFYNPILSEQDTTIEFDKDESRHIIKVLRHSKGDILHVTNGLGGIFKITLTEVNQKFCSGKITSFEKVSALPYRLHVAIAPTKSNDRFEWFLEKATELGIHRITPIICDHSERKVVKHERLSKIVESAMKQSLSAYLPILDDTYSFDDFIEKFGTTGAWKGIAHCYEEEKSSFFQEIQGQTDILLLIGPEGDFSPLEVKKALHAGFKAVTLGAKRLRTETAGMYACSQVAAINET